MENSQDNLNDLETDEIPISIKDKKLIETIFGVLLKDKSSFVETNDNIELPQMNTILKRNTENDNNDVKDNKTKIIVAIVFFILLSLPSFDTLIKVESLYVKLLIKISIFSFLIYMFFSFI